MATKMTKLHKLMLDAVDQLGAMTEHELATACLVSPKQRGGFRTALTRLYERGLVAGDHQIEITPEGVWAVEAENCRLAGVPSR